MDRVPAADGLSFRVEFTGHSGHLRIEPLPPVERQNPLHSLPDFILVDISELTAGDDNSGSLSQIVGSAKDFVKGSISSCPFRPGGLDAADSLGKVLPDGCYNGEWAQELLNGGTVKYFAQALKMD